MPPSRFRIPAHVFGYTLASIPAVWYAVYWQKNHDSDEEFEKKLMEKHSAKIQGNREKNQQMTSFFQAMKDPNKNSEHEARMREVLSGGKGSMKRHYAVDEKLYGTEEGVAKRKEAEKEQEERKKRALEKRKKKKKSGKEKKDEIPKETVEEKGEKTAPIFMKNSVTAAAGVGGLALLGMILLGGKKGQ